MTTIESADMALKAACACAEHFKNERDLARSELEALQSQNRELKSRLKEASVLIEKIGTTGVERTDIILRAEKWLAQPETP